MQMLPQKVILVGWVSFFADVSTEMMYPLIPLFLVQILGAPTFALGLVEGAAQAIVTLMTLISGTVSDKTGRRAVFLKWGYGLPAVGKAVMTIAGSWQVLLLGRSIDRFGKGLRSSPRDALIADAVTNGRTGAAFGFHRMMDTGGAFLGVLLSALFLVMLESKESEAAYRAIFGVSVGMALCSWIISFSLTDTVSPTPVQDNVPPFRGPRSYFYQLKGLGKEYWTTVFVLTLFAFANSSDTFLLLKAADSGLSGLQVVLSYALYNLTYSIAAYPAGRLSDCYGRWRILCYGWGLYALVYAGITVATSSSIWVIFLGYGLYMAFTEGVSKAIIIDAVPKERRGTALGMLYFALGSATLTSNLLTGFLWDLYGKALPFLVGAFASLSAICAVVILKGFGPPPRVSWISATKE